ncbi:4-hydroxy-tetrahydrodipicolinate reductase [Paraburkholderia sp. UYCP14C]|uniref:4-hydroxy-tetrahydrodipicolinate reductase n=1 Tax=Paraburkholderia sp. UYCP14C TaxID=2511130 RepID=UPI00102069A3|nr:4-hydroxy-tetrahydrodipicolinate reductase [Paraburkholderia sp. UYCP14C]RZF23857.1 4-hydroxy-tetrahydrodipicolinate reductase [Paraburkholderia sp. UYCP14C]
MRIAVAGATGRMGRMLIEAVLGAGDATLAGALSKSGGAALGRDAGAFAGKATGIAITDDIDTVLASCDVLLDFTRPQGTLAYLSAAQRHKVKMVIGTTGFDAAGLDVIREAAKNTAIVLASSTSVSLNVTLGLIELAARNFSQGYDIEVVEAHHRHKVDAPSGTALTIGETIANALGRKLSECAVYAREGVTGPRASSSIGFSAIRGGDIVGEHTVLFIGDGERIEIRHETLNRWPYANGALRAARFLMGRDAGLFDMHDILRPV